MPAKANKATTTPAFETAINELEELVKTLEQGDLSLEDSLKYFERGILLTRSCQTSLNEAQQKVDMLLADKDGNGAELVDMPDANK